MLIELSSILQHIKMLKPMIDSRLTLVRKFSGFKMKSATTFRTFLFIIQFYQEIV
jgi:hypothetical protein